MSVLDKMYYQKDIYDRKALEMFGEFIHQLDGESEKTDPDNASVDLKYTRTLQRARLKSKNAEIQTEYDFSAQPFSFVSWRLDSDNRYRVRIPFYELNTKTDFFLAHQRHKTVRERQKLFGYTVWLRGKKNNEVYCCPNCGAVSSVSALLEGCSYCGTKFLMEDLYPKITSFYTQKEVDVNKNVKVGPLVTAVLFVILGFILNFEDFLMVFRGTYDGPDMPFLMGFSLVTSFGAGLFLGYMLSSFQVAMLVRKSAKARTDYGFSIHAIQCKACGGSFDATKEKHCPYCGNEYSIDGDVVSLAVCRGIKIEEGMRYGQKTFYNNRQCSGSGVQIQSFPCGKWNGNYRLGKKRMGWFGGNGSTGTAGTNQPNACND